MLPAQEPGWQPLTVLFSHKANRGHKIAQEHFKAALEHVPFLRNRDVL
jgi:hypothetical protein